MYTLLLYKERSLKEKILVKYWLETEMFGTYEDTRYFIIGNPR